MTPLLCRENDIIAGENSPLSVCGLRGCAISPPSVGGSGANNFNRDYIDEDLGGEDNAGFKVFVRANGVMRHFHGDEMGPDTADPGEDSRGAPDIMPRCNVLDLTPGGRGTDWYRSLPYDKP